MLYTPLMLPKIHQVKIWSIFQLPTVVSQLHLLRKKLTVIHCEELMTPVLWQIHQQPIYCNVFLSLSLLYAPINHLNFIHLFCQEDSNWGFLTLHVRGRVNKNLHYQQYWKLGSLQNNIYVQLWQWKGGQLLAFWSEDNSFPDIPSRPIKQQHYVVLGFSPQYILSLNVQCQQSSTN